MESIWTYQSLKPNQIVLVKDGLLPARLEEEIETWSGLLSDVLTVVCLSENVGLGTSLNVGMKHCKHEYIARMDTDDLSSNDRFAVQIDEMLTSDLDICGAWVSEFTLSPSEPTGQRKVPSTHKDILGFSKYRNPMNHPAVVFRKSKVLEAGGYLEMKYFEDFYLWIRMMKRGARFGNVKKVLVNMRAGQSQIDRRRGIAYARHEVIFAYSAAKIGHLTFAEAFLCFVPRAMSRMLPKWALQLFYGELRAVRSRLPDACL